MKTGEAGHPGRPIRVTLEDFGSPPACKSTEDLDEEPAPPAEAAAAQIAPKTEPDPQAERNGHFARIASALETMASEKAALRTRCLRDAADALGAAAASLLPTMAKTGFPALVADAARSIAECGQWPELAVSLAPGDAEDISRFLTAIRSTAPGTEPGAKAAIRIEKHDDLPAGEAVLRWDGGGAEIDVAAITDAVLTEYRRKLDLLAQSGA